MKKQPIYKEDWDYLIVLDACRYDYFERIHKDYLDGDLEKKRSRGSHTTEWLEKTFTKEIKDVTYISTNPHVNGLGKPIKETSGYNSNWRATEVFDEVVDVWADDELWNDNLGTVLPEDVNKAALENNSTNRLIIHYIQPHEPYLGLQDESYHWQGKERAESNKNNRLKDTILRKVVKPFFHLFSKKTQFKIKKSIGEELSTLQRLVVEGEGEKLQELYEENLRTVFEAVKDLTEKLDGKIIITSDHGEAFGEDGEWGHSRGVDIPILRTVPWFEVEGIKEGVETQTLKTESKNKEDGNNSSEEKIKKKLEALGYKT